MYLTKSFFALLAWMASSAFGDYRWIELDGHIKLYRIPAGSIPVVRPFGIVRPNQFRNPTTTRRPFRRRPSTSKPQAFPFIVPPVTSRPMLVMGTPPPPPPETGSSYDEETLGVPGTYEGAPSLSNPGNVGGGLSSILQKPPMDTISSPDAEPLVPSQALPNNPSYLYQPSSTPQPENIANTPQPTTTKPVIPYKPQTSPVFPVVRPPAFTISRPPPKPPVASQDKEPPKNPNAQPPFDSGPYVPPKPPPVPVTSTSNFGVNPAPIGSKPQRPLPPSRPILQKPPPLPQPFFQLSTTEKPELIYNESSFSEDGNYNLDFLVSNSVYRREQGFLKKSLVKPWGLIPVKTGAYSFVSPEGTWHRVDFVADENGYRAFQSSS